MSGVGAFRYSFAYIDIVPFFLHFFLQTVVMIFVGSVKLFLLLKILSENGFIQIKNRTFFSKMMINEISTPIRILYKNQGRIRI